MPPQPQTAPAADAADVPVARAPSDTAFAPDGARTVDDDYLRDYPELPPRPRRRLLGSGANRVAVALLALLLTACGFIGGVLVEKGQGSSAASGAGGGLASRLSSLRAGTSGSGASSGSGAPGAAAGGSAGFGGGARRPTAGQVAYLSGSTLYVTTSEGNTVKVNTSPSTTVTKTVDAHVKGIHPGETVTITGAAGAGGAISAESISVGSGGGALAALFGGGTGFARGGAGGAGAGAGSTGAGGSGASGGEPELFGKGG